MTIDASVLPDTPAGAQLAALLALIEAPEPPQAEALSALFHPAFLQAVGPQALHGGLMEARGQLLTSQLVRAGSASPQEVTAVFQDEGGERWKLQASVADEQGHPFAMIRSGKTVADDGAPDWDSLVAGEAEGERRSSLDPATTAALDALLDQSRSSQRHPGLIAAVADAAGELVWVRALGTAQLRPQQTPTTTMAVRIGSISKTMTATAVVQLVERGLLDLDTDINDYLRAYRVAGPAGETLTPRQLLTHTSGLGARPGVELGCAPGKEPSLAEFYGPTLVGQGAPGSSHAYSNDAFATLGQLVTDVSGVAFEEWAIREIFDPLGMSRTSFLRDDRVSPQLFEGLELEIDHVLPVPYTDIIVRGAGSVFSTVEDMARYGAMVHGRGANSHGRVLSEESFAVLTASQPELTGLPMSAQMCLGWLRLDIGGTELLWHNGGWPGARSECAVLPAPGYTVLAFSNTMAGDLDGICFGLVKELVSR